jgi:hypothetical protein
VVDKRLHPVNEDHDPSTGLPANDAVRRHHCRLCHHHDLSQREQQQQQHQKFPTTAERPPDTVENFRPFVVGGNIQYNSSHISQLFFGFRSAVEVS